MMSAPRRRRWRRKRALVLVSLAVVLSGCARSPDTEAETDAVSSTLIVGAALIDGTGAPARNADLRVAGERITDIGDLEPRAGEKVVEGQGLVLAPGFIDTHTHHDSGLEREPGALAAVSQGITTIIAGQDGASRTPLATWFAKLEAKPSAVNVASYSGHNTLRARVLGEDYRRPSTAEETAEMAELLKGDMRAGALGLGSGLEYDPGIYSSTEEVVELARVAAAYGGRYISHLRSEDRLLFEAIEEILLIAREAEIPVQISHFKLAAKSLWGRADELLELLDQARAQGVDVTADIYPYEYWQSTLTVLFPDRVYSRANAEYALDELAPPEGLWLTAYPPEPSYVGRTLAEIAGLRGEDPVTTYLHLIEQSEAWPSPEGEEDPEEEENPEAMIIGTSMATEDIYTLLRWPHTNLCTDGGLQDRHPRGRGTYARVLGRYVRDQDVLSLESAVEKASALAARHVGLENRGLLEVGGYADLVLFDADRILDRATPQEPMLVSEGIVKVWVNGSLVYSEGTVTGATPGHVLRRPGFETSEESE